MATLSITKTYSDGTVLNEVDLDNIKDDIETFINSTKINDDNIQNSGITGSTKLVNSSVNAAKLATGAVETAKIADSAVTAAKLATAVSEALNPAGTILAFGGTTVPDGYLLCDGTAVSRTTYDDLFTAIGTAFGEGDGSTTFDLPDLRGRFLRGTDDMGTGDATRDPNSSSRTAMNTGGNTGNNVGSIQGSQFGSHNHGGGAHNHEILSTSGIGSGGISAGSYSVSGRVTAGIIPAASSSFTDSNAVQSRSGVINTNGGDETRPINAYVNYIIKT